MILKQLLPIEKYQFKNILSDEMEIMGITSDSRHVHPGYAFFAFPGSSTDGHYFIEKAIQNGASVIVFSDPSFHPDI